MQTTTETQTAEEIKKKPILVYPATLQQRQDFVDAGEAEGRTLSNFMLFAAEQFAATDNKVIDVKRDPDPAVAEKVKLIMVYPRTPEQRDRIVQASKNQGMKLSPFMVFAAEQFVAQRKKRTK